MSHLRLSLSVLPLLALALSGCSKKADAGPTAEKTAAAAESTPGADDGAKPRIVERAGRAGAQMAPLHGDSPKMKAILSPSELGYPMAGIKPISGSCAAPWVSLATAPSASGDDYAFPWVQQAIVANAKDYKVIDGDPHAAGEVALEVHKKSDYIVIARCHDAGTCTRLAAMYKDVAKASSPETGCGDLPNGLGASTRKKSLTASMPDKSDTVGLCARIGACVVAKDPLTSEDPGAACQKAPSSFKTDCGTKSSCDDVVACLK